MSAADPTRNGRGSDAWARSWTHFRIDRRTPRDCRVTFDHPPINAITTTTVAELAELVGLIEHDVDLNVVVFDSANPGFYLSHYDVEDGPVPTGRPAWIDLLVRLARAPVVSIASIRGRARGAGSEFVLACDLRFASREKTVLGGFDGGRPAARLVRLAGRARALELLLVADDRLDDEVDDIASRLARLDHDAIARTKSHVDRVTLPAGIEPRAWPVADA
jgi:enoyl-CoA hydratase/carnithine racemase